jgi:hypothetical protein
MSEIPWEVRYVRWWWYREARWHISMARAGLRTAHNLVSAQRCRRYAHGTRRQWLHTGKLPPCVLTKSEALKAMRENRPLPMPAQVRAC